MSVARSMCKLTRLVPDHPTAVLSLQLVLKLVEMLEAAMSADVIAPSMTRRHLQVEQHFTPIPSVPF